MADTNMVVQMEGVTKTYAGPPSFTALHEVSLSVESGEFLTITGQSGSGKSTLLNILGLLDRPSRGMYRLNSVDVSNSSDSERSLIRSREIGFVFQGLHLLERRSCLENAAMAGLYQGRSAKESNRSARQWLEAVGLEGRAEQMPSTMSGGERQRVAVARALSGGARLLICDEPTGSLDSANTTQIIDLLLRLNAEGVTVVVVTHEAAVARLGSRSVAIMDGQLCSDGA